jgi:anti-sigma regulatory factor (Ser/Thr protein kinase)
MLGTSELSITNDISYLPAVQAFAGEVAGQCGFGEKDRVMILLALEEAVTNVIDHAFEYGEKATFKIIFEPKSTCLTIIVKDKGLPYEPNLVPEFSIDSDLEHGSASGLGSLLMRKSVDEVSYHNLGREGKELHLTKYFPFKDITEYHSPEELEAFPQKSEPAPAPTREIKAEIRLMRPQEAVEVSQLFYRCYGYSYSIDSIYYPDRFAQLVVEGKIISAVTITGDNEIVGHVGLVRAQADSIVAEAGMAATKPNFRGFGSMTKMVNFLADVAKKAGLEGLYGKAISFHTYSQKTGYACGYRDCAVALGVIPSDRIYKGIMDSVSQRGSVVYSFLPLVDQKPATLYVPSQHAVFIESIYGNLDLNVRFVIPENGKSHDMEERCTIKTELLPSFNRADVEIVRYGADVLEETAKVLKDLLKKKVDQVSLFLDLEHPMTAHFCGEFEKSGFFIAGVIPLLHFNHTLILQYLNNVSLDYSQIQLNSEFAKNMLEYIRERDPNV